MTTATEPHTPSLPSDPLPEPLLVAGANIDPEHFYTLAEVARLTISTRTKRPVQIQTVRHWVRNRLLRAAKQRRGLKWRYVVRGSELIRFLSQQVEEG